MILCCPLEERRLQSSAYMSVDSRFRQFLSNLRLSEQQIQDGQAKYDGVCRKLHAHYYPGQPFTGQTRQLAGSYSKGTAIRPARDIDVLFKLPSSTFIRSSTTYNIQSQLLQRVKGVIQERYPNTHIRGDGPVVVVDFSDGHFIEIVPAFALTGGGYYVPDTRDGGKWKMMHPLAEVDLVNKSDIRSGGNTRSLIKMMKRWQDYCQVPIKSLVLELRAVYFLENYEHYNKSPMYYDWMVRDYLASLVAKADASATLPGTEEKIDYGNDWKSKAESAYARAVKACQYEADGNPDAATLEWKKIFGDDYWFE